MSDLARHAPSVAPFISLIPVLIAGISMKARRKLIERLRAAGATDAAHAVPIDPQSRMERNWLRRLESMDIIKAVRSGYYYDEATVAARHQSQVRLIPLVLIIVAAVVGLACAIVLIGGRH
jgi:hypothetical protein